MSSPGESEQPRADLTPAERLEWQSELDSAMSDLDSALSHPRRRASDVAPPPVAPQLGNVNITGELLDEIAWRVSEQLRRTQAAAPGTAPAVIGAAAPLPPAAKPAPPALPPGISLVIRVRRPLFHWKFWRRRSRRRQAMITFSDYRIT